MKKYFFFIVLFTSSIGFASPPNYIKNAPKGQWTKIGSNSAKDVSFGWGKFDQLFGVWSGSAYDPRIPALYFTGGGHNSYDGNEFYAFRMDKNLWERVNDPSPYKETDASGGILPDGLPQAVHTYGEIECDWDTGIIYRFSGGGSPIRTTFSFDPSYSSWPIPYSETLNAWKDTRAPTSDTYGGAMAWDPVTKKFFGGNGTFFQPRFMDPKTNTSEELPYPAFPGKGFAPGGYIAIAIDPTERLMYIVGGKNELTGKSYVSRGLITYNIDTHQWIEHTPNTRGDKFPETSARGGLTYDSKRELMWWWDGAPNTKSLFNFNMKNKTWARIDPAGESPVNAYSQGTFNKFRYIEKYDVFVAVGGSTSSEVEIWMYKPNDWMDSGPLDSIPPSMPSGLDVK